MSQNAILQSDTYVATGNGTTIDASHAPFKSYGLLVKATGTPTLWTVVLEGSLDNVNFDTILTHSNVSVGLNKTMWSGASYAPAAYVRSRLVTLTLGGATNLIVQWLGMQ